MGSDQLAQLDHEPAATADTKRWRIGTLAYTTSGLVAVIFWLLLGDFGNSLRDRAYPDSINLLMKKLDASNTALAFLTIFLPQGIAMLFGPTISYKSDRFRGRFGRRVPFLLLATPIVAMAMIGIAFAPQLGTMLHAISGSGSAAIAYFALIVVGVVSAFYHLASVGTTVTFSGLINDVIPRPVLGRFFAMFRIVSLICGVIINYFVLRHVEAHFRLVFVSLALVFAITFVLMCLKVKEGAYPPPEHTPDDFRAGGFLAAVRIYFRECFSVSYYRWVIAALALGSLAGVPVNVFSVYYMKSLGLSVGDYGTIKAINHACGMLLAYPIGMLVDRFHALRISMATMALYALTLLLGGVFIRTPWSFGWAVFGHMVVSGLYLSASGALAQMLLPRIKFAQFFSASVVISSIATMITSVILGFILDNSGSNYRLTYFAGFGVATVCLATMAVVYRKFTALGGKTGYVPPE
jgi:MFS family permease